MKTRVRASTFLRVAALFTALGAGVPASGQVASSSPRILQKVAFDQKLNAPLPLDSVFHDESGRPVRLGEFFGRKPVIVTLVYYGCPMLCTQELNVLTSSLRVVPYDVGRDFEIVTVSIHPRETPKLAGAKKAAYLRRYGRAGAAQGWHFLTGDESSIAQLAQAVGFRYVYDPKSDQFAHPAGLVIATPNGRVARYFLGLDYPARDLRLGLLEASAGKVGSPIEQLLLICYHYDPATGRYSFMIMNVVRILGAATVLALASFLFVMHRRERSRARGQAQDLLGPLFSSSGNG